VQFDSVVVPDGTRHQLDGALTELQDARAGKVDAENEVSGNSSDKRNVAYVGGGTVGGAVLGGAIGGGKGAGIGAIIGAGAGVAGVMLTKGNEAELRSGTEIGMVTVRPITFSVRADPR
jgi:outer membrane lipoprotein SlyB